MTTMINSVINATSDRKQLFAPSHSPLGMFNNDFKQSAGNKCEHSWCDRKLSYYSLNK